MNKLVSFLAFLALAALVLSISKGALKLPKETASSAQQSVENH
jgi:hypothetical protein